MRKGTTRRRLTMGLAVVAVAGLTAGAAGAWHGWGNDGDRSRAIAKQIEQGPAKNVILFIGDGMGESEITLARNYALGAAGEFKGIDSLTFTGDVTTYSVQETNPLVPDYVPDSAATGTAWATGVKTSNERISTSAGTDKDLKTILEIAQARGYATGNVSTAEITDATPAVLASHVTMRGCQGPANMASCPQDLKAAGGPGSINEQFVDHGIDVILGGGGGRWLQTIPFGGGAGGNVEAYAQSKGYTLVKTNAALQATSAKKVLGLFNPGNMVTEWNGTPAAAVRTGPQRCNETFRATTSPTEPRLVDMTTKAISTLEKVAKAKKGDEGFFLQVEGASIDKQDHAANPCAQIGETVEFDRAIQAGLEYAKRHPDTLVIVTADHSHTSQIIPQTGASPGLTSVLIGRDATPGQITCVVPNDNRASTAPGCITVNYATSTGSSQAHTGATVRVAAVGPQAANVLGLVDQTELFDIMERALRY